MWPPAHPRPHRAPTSPPRGPTTSATRAWRAQTGGYTEPGAHGGGDNAAPRKAKLLVASPAHLDADPSFNDRDVGACARSWQPRPTTTSTAHTDNATTSTLDQLTCGLDARALHHGGQLHEHPPWPSTAWLLCEDSNTMSAPQSPKETRSGSSPAGIKSSGGQCKTPSRPSPYQPTVCRNTIPHASAPRARSRSE